jgi:MFS family permease
MMALLAYPLWVFFARTLDRLGKGIRTGARDALLSDESTMQTKGRVFGFHRAMDTFGAVIGPVSALVYLHYYPENYKVLFYIAFVPGLAALSLTLLIRENKNQHVKPVVKTRLLDFIRYWKESPGEYRRIVGGLLVFTLFNSSDVFLLLKLKDAGFNDAAVIGFYILYNLVYATFSYPMGMLADRFGMKKVFILGLLLFAAVYAGMAFAQNKPFLIMIFFLYGLYAAATEGVAKAWITNISKKENTATAIGTYTAFQSVATLIASSLAGVIWYSFGAPATFAISAVVAVLVSLYCAGIRTH